MPDLKEISHEIAKAIFDSIEQDRTLILSRIADVVHKELAMRLPELEREMYPLHEVKPVQPKDHSAEAERWRQMIKYMEGTFSPFPDPPKQTATVVRERAIAQQRGHEEAARAEAWRKTKELLSSGAAMFPPAPAPRVENACEPRWYAWDFTSPYRDNS